MIKIKIFSAQESKNEDLSMEELRNRALDKLNSDLSIGRIVSIIEKTGMNEKRDFGYDWYQNWITLVVYYEEILESPIKILYKDK